MIHEYEMIVGTLIHKMLHFHTVSLFFLFSRAKKKHSKTWEIGPIRGTPAVASTQSSGSSWLVSADFLLNETDLR